MHTVQKTIGTTAKANGLSTNVPMPAEKTMVEAMNNSGFVFSLGHLEAAQRAAAIQRTVIDTSSRAMLN